MGLIFYNIFLWIFRIAVNVAAPFNAKAKKWVTGRKDILDRLKIMMPKNEKIIWIHCASLGEFEQGRPVMEEIRKNYPSTRILLSFFSPSGYEVQKNYPGADWVIYMPLDGPNTARIFLERVRPSLVIFVKYEFWYYYLKKIRYRQIPLLLISAYFRKDMSFFKWHGTLQRKMLSRFDHLFVQDQSSKKLLDDLGLDSITSVSGDTRFDRVFQIADQAERIPAIEQFINDKPVLIAGSTWPEDEALLREALNMGLEVPLKLIIAPHELNEKHLEALGSLFPGAIRYSHFLNTAAVDCNVMIIDNIGLLSKLYRYATFCYVGGGLRIQGVHNVLEAAVFEKLVFMGPYYKKYREAVALKQSGGAISVKNGKDLSQWTERLLANDGERKTREKAAGDFVKSHTGATQKILNFIQEKRLLTN